MPSWLRYATILVVDSDPVSLGTKLRILTDRGFNCHEATCGQDALRLMKVIKFDLLISAMYLRDIDGATLSREIRRQHNTLLAVCGHQRDAYDEVACLEAGADDYLAEPIDPSVLVARVRALLRRALLTRDVEKGTRIGDLEFDDDRLQVFHEGNPLKFTSTEFKLFKLLAQKPNHAISRDSILTNVWNTSYLGDKRVVDTHIRNLRKKLRDANSSVLIHSVRGVGYRLVSGGQDSSAIRITA